MEVLNCFIKWSNFIGLIISFIGAIYLSLGLFVSKKKALELSVSRWSGDTDEENLKLPQVQNILKQSRNAQIGIVLITVGFFFQILGSLP